MPEEWLKPIDLNSHFPRFHVHVLVPVLDVGFGVVAVVAVVDVVAVVVAVVVGVVVIAVAVVLVE